MKLSIWLVAVTAGCTGTAALRGDSWFVAGPAGPPPPAYTSSSGPADGSAGAESTASAPEAEPVAEPELPAELQPLEAILADVQSDVTRSRACWLDDTLANAKAALAKVEKGPHGAEGRRMFQEAKALIDAQPWMRGCRALAKDAEYRRLSIKLAQVTERWHGSLELWKLPQGTGFCDVAPRPDECKNENVMLSLQGRIQVVEERYFPD